MGKCVSIKVLDAFLYRSLPKTVLVLSVGKHERMSNSENWYVVKQENGECAVLNASQVELAQIQGPQAVEQWGPYPSQQEAIARRVGSIRAGKCKPA